MRLAPLPSAALLLAALLSLPGVARAQVGGAHPSRPPAPADTLWGFRYDLPDPPLVAPAPGRPGASIAPPRTPGACCAPRSAASVDPEILIVPDTTWRAHIRLLRPPEGIDPHIFLPNPDLSGGCFGVE